ncbi:FkbM family methyltransferase [Novipirellula caenicola]|uniref:Methyltransferase FkbM domain-containing protein n=1 Tax=Novipirellula caenicola TaxID=1536901 RepID=A0ABP9VPM3_9BACT
MSDASSWPSSRSKETDALLKTRHHNAGSSKTHTHGSEGIALMRRYDIDLVLDVGANCGQYSQGLIHHGYVGRIISFEPDPKTYATLSETRRGFRNWKAEPFALSDKNGTAILSVAANGRSHSLQNHGEDAATVASESDGGAEVWVGRVSVRTRRLDAMFDDYYTSGDRCFVKLDVQGHEHRVLAGSSGCLERIVAIQMPLSISPAASSRRAKGENPHEWQESIESMSRLGYELMLPSPTWSEVTPSSGQADAIFVRREAISRRKAAA